MLKRIDGLPAFPFVLEQVLAGPHANFHYIIGDLDTGDAALVDPAFELDALFGIAHERGLTIRDAFFTHGHRDHIGGVPAIIARGVDRIYIHEAARLHAKVEEALEAGAEVGLASDGDTVMMGNVPVRVLHTPGHQPESACLLVGEDDGNQALFGGDTLFIGSCGRTDFPGGDTDAMFTSMARLRGLASAAVHVMPGHDYGAFTTRPLLAEAVDNPALATTDRDAFDKLPCLRG